MNVEIERKFLLADDSWKTAATEIIVIRQGYLSTAADCAVRVRRSGEKAWLTLKGRPANGVAPEFEYAIPASDADDILNSLAQRPFIEKKRHLVPYDGMMWEIDEFLGDNAGLVLAEMELTAPDQCISLPSWVGKEVTGDPRFYNANLVAAPFCTWKDSLPTR